MSSRPQDLPELRAELLSHYDSPRGVREWAPRTFEPASVIPDADGTLLVCDPSTEERRTYEVGRLKAAELYFVSDAMAQLADAAGKTLPAFKVDEEDLPSPAGLMLFEHPLHDVIVESDGIDTKIQAVSWSIARNDELGPSLWLSFYANLDHSRDEIEARYGPVLGGIPKLFYSHDCEWSFNSGHRPGDRDALSIWGRIVISTWLLMRQPLTTETDVPTPRAVRKRLARAGHKAAPVRVIELRRPKSSGEPGAGESNYHHQWIVRGHWRQHWYPKRQVHRPVWIAPHIKGPEGAPLIGGEKVYALKR
jgi:hypothetical protein